MDHLLDDISFCNFYYYTIFSLFYNISLTLKLFSLQIRYFLDMNAKFGPKIKKKRKEITVKKDTNFQCRVYIMIFFLVSTMYCCCIYFPWPRTFLKFPSVFYIHIYIKIKELYLALLLRVEIMTNILWWKIYDWKVLGF